MSLEEKLRRTAGALALAVCALALVLAVGAALGADVLRGWRFEPAPMRFNCALVLLLTGAALWCLHRERFPRAGLACAGLAAALAGAHALEHLFNVNLHVDELFVRDWFADASVAHPGRIARHTAFALPVAALAVAALAQRRHRARWPVSAWLANLVIAFAVAALFALAFNAVTGVTRPLRIGTHAALALLLLGAGTLLARPRDRFVLLMFERDTAGALARRLFYGAAVVPVLLGVVMVALLRAQLIEVADGVILLTVGLIVCGFGIALFSSGVAAEIREDREEAEQARLLLTARLQEQAAQLQETVGLRTRELREANAHLRASSGHLQLLNERLALATRSAALGVWDWDAATQRSQWDARTLEIYGLTAAQHHGTGEDWLQRVHPDDRARALEGVQAVLAGGNDFDQEFRIIRASDGAVRHIESRAIVVRDAHGRLLRITGTDRDITTEREVAQQTETLNERLRLALRSSNFGVWELDAATHRMVWDEHMFEIYGVPRAGFDGSRETWRRCLHPEDRERAFDLARQVIAGEVPHYDTEFRIVRPDGTVRCIEAHGYVQRDPSGRAVRLVGLNRDITESRQLEERVRKSEELAAQVSELALIGGWEYDLESAQLTWTDGVRRIHEVDDAFQPTLENTERFYPPEARALLVETLNRAEAATPVFDHEIALVTARGRHRWVRVLGRTEFRADGQPLRVHGAMQDITARHESEESRRELETQLFQAQKMETLGTLAGGIAHDFNNLLTGIIGYHELAADSVPEDHPARACLAEARNASLRARELVEQILTFGRQSPGGGHVPLDLAPVAEEARRFLRATLPATITLELRVAPDCPPALGDATQIHQVLLNLGSNAAHAMRHHGGTLTIALEPAEVTPDLAHLLGGPTATSYVRIAVSDTGHGMDEATRRRIFDPFFTTKNTREGTGLGLAVVHGIVRAHRGAIDVESTPGAGATFNIYLPTATTDNELDDGAQGPVPRGAGEFICVVDDEEVVGSCTKLVLESKGYQVIVFTAAEQCLAGLADESASCALLVTDQTMPGMQGTELVAAARKLNPNLPVVIMSGYFSKISPQELDELGQVELLAKPFTTDELTAAVHRALHPEPAKT